MKINLVEEIAEAMNLAPIALFVYKRPWHVEQTIEALKRNRLAQRSELFIFSDGPKSEVDKKGVINTREYIKSISGFKAIHIIARDCNWGLANSVISGVTELCCKFGRVIVLEDDLIVSPLFLDFMNDALDKYASVERVMQVSGYMFPVNVQSDADAVLLPFTTSWGWATWQRAWGHFDRNTRDYEKLKLNKSLRNSFNLNGAYPYFNMLRDQREGKVDSWAILWYLKVFFLSGLALFPAKTLVQNIGLDGSGTHCIKGGKDGIIDTSFRVTIYPQTIECDDAAKNKIFSYLAHRNSLICRVREKFRG